MNCFNWSGWSHANVDCLTILKSRAFESMSVELEEGWRYAQLKATYKKYNWLTTDMHVVIDKGLVEVVFL